MTTRIRRAVGARRCDIAVVEDDMVMRMREKVAEYGYVLVGRIVVIDPDQDEPTAELIAAVLNRQAEAVVVPSLPHLCELTQIGKVCGVITVDPETPSNTRHLSIASQRFSDD